MGVLQAAIADLLGAVRSVLADLAPQAARRAAAEERQAAALEQINDKLGLLLKMDPELLAYLNPGDLGEEGNDAEVEVSSPLEREVTADQLERYKQLHYQSHGVVLSDEEALEGFERDFNAAIERRLHEQGDREM